MILDKQAQAYMDFAAKNGISILQYAENYSGKSNKLIRSNKTEGYHEQFEPEISLPFPHIYRFNPSGIHVKNYAHKRNTTKEYPFNKNTARYALIDVFIHLLMCVCMMIFASTEVYGTRYILFVIFGINLFMVILATKKIKRILIAEKAIRYN